MVCDWGMSKLGPIALGENADHIFLGRDITRTQNYSEGTAHAIDREISAIIDEECVRARKSLKENAEALKAVVHTLLEQETVDGEDVYALLRSGGKEAAPKARKAATEEESAPKKRGRRPKESTPTDGGEVAK
jgi:cell division protease FtsH